MLMLRDLIAHAEANNCQWALRYEPATFANLARHPQYNAVINNAAVVNHCSHVTAQQIISTSYGLYQFMGFNIYGALGWQKFIGEFMADVEAQHALFDKFTQQLGIAYTVEEIENDTAKRQAFARKYNGPGNVIGYSLHLMDTLKRLRAVPPVPGVGGGAFH